jgi:ATP-dependent Zn protease
MDPVHKISIVQRGFGALGYTMQLPLEDRYLMQRRDLLNQLAVLLGGRTAEEIALGEISTGAQNDLQRATDIARAMVTEWGNERFAWRDQLRRAQAQQVSRYLPGSGAWRVCRGHRSTHRCRGQAHHDRVAQRSATDFSRASVRGSNT